MRTAMVFLIGFMTAFAATAQLHPDVGPTFRSERGDLMTRVTLNYFDRENHDVVTVLDSVRIVFPRKMNGTSMVAESSRFRAQIGGWFTEGERAFVTVAVYYDNLTSHPQDDVFIAAPILSVDRELVLAEERYFPDSPVEEFPFRRIPMGQPAYE